MNRLVSHLINLSDTDVTVPCSATGLSTCSAVNDRGIAQGWPLLVPARGSVTVLANDPAWRR
jgi:hypothetical protein